MAAVEVLAAKADDVADMHVDAPSGAGPADVAEEDLYTRLKTLQRQLEFLDIQEDYIKEEQKNLKVGWGGLRTGLSSLSLSTRVRADTLKASHERWLAGSSSRAPHSGHRSLGAYMGAAVCHGLCPASCGCSGCRRMLRFVPLCVPCPGRRQLQRGA